jgi:hypothetical protein
MPPQTHPDTGQARIDADKQPGGAARVG